MVLSLGKIALVFLAVFSNQGFSKTTKKEAKVMHYEIKTVELKPQAIITIKSKAKIEQVGDKIGEIFGRLEEYMKAKKISVVGAPFTRTYEFRDGQLEFESGFPVAGPAKSEGEMIVSELAGGKAVTTFHVGPQESSEKAYEALKEWMQQNQKTPAGAPWEVYLTDPATTKPEQAKMQVFFPVK